MFVSKQPSLLGYYLNLRQYLDGAFTHTLSLCCNDPFCFLSHLVFFLTQSIDGAFMIAAPLTMTRMREQSVDFIHPFQVTYSETDVRIL